MESLCDIAKRVSISIYSYEEWDTFDCEGSDCSSKTVGSPDWLKYDIESLIFVIDTLAILQLLQSNPDDQEDIFLCYRVKMVMNVRYPIKPTPTVAEDLNGLFDTKRVDPNEMNKDFCLRPYCEVTVFKSPVETRDDLTILISAWDRKSTPQTLTFDQFELEFDVTTTDNQLVQQICSLPRFLQITYTLNLPESLASLSNLIYFENQTNNKITLGEIVVDSSLEHIIDACHELTVGGSVGAVQSTNELRFNLCFANDEPICNIEKITPVSSGSGSVDRVDIEIDPTNPAGTVAMPT